MFKPCGCLICKSGFGENVNDFAINGKSDKFIIKYLTDMGVKIDRRILKNHLSVYDLEIKKHNKTEVLNLEKIEIDMINIDFSKYDFDINKSESIINYLQKLHLKIHLNMCEILLFYQQKLLNGEVEDIPDFAIRGILSSEKMLHNISGISHQININAAIRLIESEGYRLNYDVQNRN